MSQEMISQKIKKTCDGCGSITEYELIGIQPGDPTQVALEQWYTVIREVLDPDQGRFVKILVQACSLACVPAAAVKLALPPQEEPPTPIDLNSLRVN